MTQEPPRVGSEDTFASLAVELLMFQCGQDIIHMSKVLLPVLAENQNVTQERDDRRPDEWAENVIHEAHKCGEGIGELKSHFTVNWN